MEFWTSSESDTHKAATQLGDSDTENNEGSSAQQDSWKGYSDTSTDGSDGERTGVGSPAPMMAEMLDLPRATIAYSGVPAWSSMQAYSEQFWGAEMEMLAAMLQVPVLANEEDADLLPPPPGLSIGGVTGRAGAEAAEKVEVPEGCTKSGPQDRFHAQFRKTQLCRYINTGCLRGEKCFYAHSRQELRSPPDLAKTSLCKLWQQSKCPRTAAECQFAHGPRDLRVSEGFAPGMEPVLSKAKPKAEATRGKRPEEKEGPQGAKEKPAEKAKQQSKPQQSEAASVQQISPMTVSIDWQLVEATAATKIQQAVESPSGSSHGDPSQVMSNVSTSRSGEKALPAVSKNRERFLAQFHKTQFCRYVKSGCLRGTQCPFAHSVQELSTSPDLAKTSLCKLWEQGLCQLKASECQFAHGTRDLRMTSAYAKAEVVQKQAEHIVGKAASVPKSALEPWKVAASVIQSLATASE